MGKGILIPLKKEHELSFDISLALHFLHDHSHLNLCDFLEELVESHFTKAIKSVWEEAVRVEQVRKLVNVNRSTRRLPENSKEDNEIVSREIVMSMLKQHMESNPNSPRYIIRLVIPWTHFVPASDDYPATGSTLRTYYAKKVLQKLKDVLPLKVDQVFKQ